MRADAGCVAVAVAVAVAAVVAVWFAPPEFLRVLPVSGTPFAGCHLSGDVPSTKDPLVGLPLPLRLPSDLAGAARGHVLR